MEETGKDIKKKKAWKPRPKYMGVVTKWIKERGFGFIRCYEDGESYYVHYRAIKNDVELVRGAVVEFEIWTEKEDPEKHFAGNVLVCEVPEYRSRRG